MSDQPKDSAKEIELKLRVAPGDLASLRRHAYLADLPCAPSTETLVSVYFDSDDLALRQHGLTLRVRHIGDRRLQTIKGSGGGPDYLERPEWEQPIEGDQPVLNDVAAAFSPVLTDEVRNSLKPVFETRVERIAYRLNGGETDIALAIDQGEIVANGASVPLSEIELELKHGDPGELFKVARSIADIVPVQLDVRSKAERGYDLFENKPVGADKGHDPKLSPDLSTGRAFTLIGRACVRHLLANEPGTELRDAESLHQMRIALRRLRSAISLFSGVVTDRRLEAIKAELKWIGGELAPARDLDAFLTEILKPLRRQHRDDPGLASIGKMLARERLKGYRQAQEAVKSERFRALVLDTAEWIEAGPWSTSQDPLQQARRDLPVHIHATDELARRRKKIKRRGAKIADLTPEEMHRLRIQVKKMRYASEFFADVYSGKKAARRGAKFQSALRRLQTCLGDFNDIMTSKARCDTIVKHPARGLSAEQKMQRAFAAGIVTGDQQGRLLELRGRGLKAHSRFSDVKPFWK